jgi:DNA helicase-2/ATP-dependent DNA helicase PcrA
MTTETPTRAELRRKAKQALNPETILQGANPEQAVAIQHGEGPLGVFAGAGSGKTRVLCARMAFLVAMGVNPARILAVTFSKKAAVEMEERARKMGVLAARVGTWHSLALQILREEHAIDEWTIDDKDRAKVILKANVLGYKGMNWRDADIGVVSSYISFCKSQLWGPESDGAREYAKGERRLVEAYRRYEAELLDNRLLTFDCMLCKAVDLLRVEDTRLRWAARWDYVMQDEAQDANPAQMAIAEALARDHKNYMVVGDPAQSIYGWRGSKPEYVMEFEQAWPGAKVVTMNRNYRCGSAVVAVANKAISPATMRLPADLVAEGGWQGGVSFWREADLDGEATRIASIVQENARAGQPYEAHTVLFRTNAQSRALEEAFLAEKIPYVVVGGTSFYERKEVKDLLAYLRTAIGRELEQNVRRCVNAPFRYIGAVTVDKLLSALGARHGDLVGAIGDISGELQRRQVSSLTDWLDAVGNVDQGAKRLAALTDNRTDTDHVGTVLDALVREVGYVEWLKRDQGEEGLDSSHVANVKELVRVASRFATVESFLDFIDETIAKSKEAKQGAGEGRVLLMSIHRSKGLEWPFVFVCGCSEGILPHPRGDAEEERRLFYVAVTRAAQHAYLTSPASLALRAGVKAVGPSQFVEEVMDLLAVGEFEVRRSGGCRQCPQAPSQGAQGGSQAGQGTPGPQAGPRGSQGGLDGPHLCSGKGGQEE